MHHEIKLSFSEQNYTFYQKIIKFVGLLSNNKEKMIDFYECMKDTYYYIGRVAPFVIRYLFMVIMLLLPLSLYSIQQSPVFVL